MTKSVCIQFLTLSQFIKCFLSISMWREVRWHWTHHFRIPILHLPPLTGQRTNLRLAPVGIFSRWYSLTKVPNIFLTPGSNLSVIAVCFVFNVISCRSVFWTAHRLANLNVPSVSSIENWAAFLFFYVKILISWKICHTRAETALVVLEAIAGWVCVSEIIICNTGGYSWCS